jgi:hypothetical protein
VTYCLHQLVEGELSIFDGLAHAVFNDPALKVYRLSGWRWQLDSGGILSVKPEMPVLGLFSFEARLRRWLQGLCCAWTGDWSRLLGKRSAKTVEASWVITGTHHNSHKKCKIDSTSMPKSASRHPFQTPLAVFIVLLWLNLLCS